MSNDFDAWLDEDGQSLDASLDKEGGVLEAFLRGLRSRDAEAGGFPEHYGKAERAVLSTARHSAPGQLFNYLAGVVREPGRVPSPHVHRSV